MLPFFDLTNDTIILTPNRRLSRYLSNKLNLELQQQKTAWQTPAIFPYHSWLKILFEKYSDLILLNEHRERILWTSIIKSENATTIALARKAWETIKQWKIPLSALANYSDETKIFSIWANAFDTICKNKNLCDKNTVSEIIVSYVKNGQIKLPARIYLVGFDDISPEQQELLQVFSKFSAIEYIDINNLVADEKKIACPNSEMEMLTMARWAHKTLSQNPNTYIGCVVPNLVQLRDSIERTFTQTFSDYQVKPFNISAGKTLDQFPIVYTALKILELNIAFTTTNINYLLSSPFIIGATTEKIPRALLRSQLKQLALEEINLDLILKNSACPIFTQALQTINHHSQTKNPNTWAQLFLTEFEYFGLGKTSLNDEENKALQHFYKSLHELSSLNLVIDNLTCTQALGYLNNIVSNSIFQKPSQQQPIDILGILEAAGINFDYLWIMGMDNASFPPPPSPNPFIPLPIQKKLNLPHASHERELEFSKKIIKRLAQSSKSIIYSYPLTADDRKLKPNFMIQNTPLITENDLKLSESIEEHTKKTEIFVEPPFCPITANEKIHGGTKIFELQALCPFRAFAALRLRAQSKPAWRNIMRGILVHAVLEEIWGKIVSHETLLQYSAPILQELIASAVNRTVKKHHYDLLGISDFLIEIEKTCIAKIVFDWMQLEKSRPPFEIISLEQKHEISFDGLALRLRIDRIDKLADGTIIIIDYKTGKQSISIFGWLNENLTNPQLPLYCITTAGDAGSIAFAELKPNALGFKGITKKDLQIDGIKFIEDHEWSELLTKWRSTLTQLAQDFRAGNAMIAPKPGACRTCELKVLCRVKKF